MEINKKTKRLIIFIFAIVFIAVVILFIFLRPSSEKTEPLSTIAPTVTQVNDSVFYNGEEGKDALMLLEENATVEKSSSGLVVSINGREASEDSKEFWAFYVNGEMAEVGPADYPTEESDLIEWKIENY